MYSNFKADDLIEAPGFTRWVMQEDRESEIFWSQWLKDNQDKKLEVEKARALILAMGVAETGPSNREIEGLWSRIDKKVSKLDQRTILGFAPRIFKLTAAAVLAGIVVTYALLNLKVGFGDFKKDQIAVIEKICPAGQKSTITLTDGTRIKLNANSKLTFPETFSADSREVELVGEAFFEVTRDPSRPFTITTGDLKTRVLGTSFNIMAYPACNKIKVAVATGKVSVKSFDENEQKNEVTLLPNEMALYSKISHELSLKSFDQEEELAWKDGILIFKNQNINGITAELAKWYGVSFVLDKKLNIDKDYTGRFDNKSLDEVLTGMSFVFDFEFKIDNKVVTIN